MSNSKNDLKKDDPIKTDPTNEKSSGSSGGQEKDQRIAAFKKMKSLMATHYLTAKNAGFNEQPIAWVTSGAPVEFLHAAGIVAVYPENHAAMASTAAMGVELQEAAEGLGYSPDLCSYARTDIGQMTTGGGPIMGLPRPDFLLACNNICNTTVKWYETAGRHYGVPVFVLDTPFVHEEEIPEPTITYVKDQFHEFVQFLEEKLGRPFDWDAFVEVLMRSASASTLWGEVLEMCQAVPSPMTGFDAFVHMAPIVTLRGLQECIDYYEVLKAEIEERVRENFGAVPEERHRLLWDNLPIWFRLRGLSEKFASLKACLVGATYTASWAAIGADLTDTSDPLTELARAYIGPYINRSFPTRVRIFKEMIRDYSADGFIMHSDRSCKPYSLGQHMLCEAITRETGAPGIVIEADMCDERLYAEGPIFTRLEAFIEKLDQGGAG